MKKLVIIGIILSIIILLGLSAYACENEKNETNINKITLKHPDKLERHSCKPTATPTEEPTIEPTEKPEATPTVEPTEKPEVVTEEPTPTEEVVVVEDNDDDSDVVYESGKTLPKTGESESGANAFIYFGLIFIVLGMTAFVVIKRKKSYNRN